MTEISIIIPCFNHGEYLLEAIESVRSLSDAGIASVIVVNDGSTAEDTLLTFEQLEKEGWRILHQNNLGLAEARNNGIRASSSPFILPLDSDNLVINSFVTRAIDILKGQPNVDIVYSDSLHFGAVDFYNKVGEYDPCKLISHNYIDACAIYRRSVWEELMGYDSNMPAMGHEDWEFWVGATLRGKAFKYLPTVGFKYRVRNDSMLHTVTAKGGDNNRNYIYSKYNKALLQSIYRNFNGAEDNYKAKYLDLLEKLNKRSLKNVIKILLGMRFY